MKIGERGQVTIPKEIRDRFGLRPTTEVKFEVVKDEIVLRKSAPPLNLRKWKGRCAQSLKDMGFKSTDEFIEAIRGR